MIKKKFHNITNQVLNIVLLWVSHPCRSLLCKCCSPVSAEYRYACDLAIDITIVKGDIKNSILNHIKLLMLHIQP